MDHSPFFVYSCWNLTSLFNFWNDGLNGHVEVTNPNESIDTVYPADKTSFVPRCPKLNSLIVGDMVTLGAGAQPIFSPHISVTIARCLLLWLLVWARSPVFTCRLSGRQRGTESRVSREQGWWQQEPAPVVTAHSLTPGMVTSREHQPIFAELTTFLTILTKE